ncbi:hypothetical protein C8J57DRAFT_1311064 [Mycena rebaudengoi]|nr:hypothetical protein C8J57DRAFT_1311064 [Mycena rebaudengoi]
MNGIIGMTELTLDSDHCDLDRSQRESLLLVHSHISKGLLLVLSVTDHSSSQGWSNENDDGNRLILDVADCLRHTQDACWASH